MASHSLETAHSLTQLISSPRPSRLPVHPYASHVKSGTHYKRQRKTKKHGTDAALQLSFLRQHIRKLCSAEVVSGNNRGCVLLKHAPIPTVCHGDNFIWLSSYPWCQQLSAVSGRAHAWRTSTQLKESQQKPLVTPSRWRPGEGEPSEPQLLPLQRDGGRSLLCRAHAMETKARGYCGCSPVSWKQGCPALMIKGKTEFYTSCFNSANTYKW